MSDANIDIDFKLNTAEVESDLSRIKNGVNSVGTSAAEANAKIKRSVENLQQGSIKVEQSLAQLTDKNILLKDAAFGEKDLNKIKTYNQEIQNTDAQIKRLTNVGKTGFDEMGNAIGKSTNYATKAFSALRQAAYILPGIGIAGLLNLAIEPLLNYIAKLDIFKAKVDAILLVRKEVSNANLKGAQDAQKELVHLKELIDTSKNVELSQKQRYDAAKKLQDLYPDTFKNLTIEQIELGKTGEAYKALSENILATARAKASEDKIAEYSSRLLGNEDKIAQAKEVLKKAKQTIERDKKAGYVDVDINAEDGGGIKTSVTSTYIANNQILEQEKLIRDTNTDTAIAKAKILALTKNIFDQQKKGANIVGSDKNGDSTIEIDKSEALQKRIIAIKEKYNRKSLDKDAEARKAINDEFAALIRDVEKHNQAYEKYAAKYGTTKADAKIGKKVDASSLEPLKAEAIADLTYRQDTIKQAKAFEEQKKLFAEYENYKTIFGEQKAKERFGNEVKTNRELLEQIKSDYAKLAIANGLKLASGNAPLARETERLEQLKKNLEEIQSIEDKQYAEAYKSAMTYMQKIELINDKFRKQIALINANANKQDVSANIKVLEEKREAEINAEKETALKKMEVIKNLNEKIIILSRDEIKERLKSLRTILQDPTLSEGLKQDLSKMMNDLEKDLNLSNKGLKLQGLEKEKSNLVTKIEDRKKLNITSPEGVQELKKMEQELATIQGKINEINQGGLRGFLASLKDNKTLQDLSTGLGLASDATAMLSRAFKDLDEGTSDTLDAVSQLSGALSNLAAGLAKDDPAAIIGGLIQIADVLFNMQAKAIESEKKAAEEMAKFRADAFAGELSYNEILRTRKLLLAGLNKLGLDAIADKERELALAQKSLEVDRQKVSVKLMGDVNYNNALIKDYKNGKKTFADVLNSITGGRYISGEHTEKYGGIFGFGEKTRVVKEYSSLIGKSYDEIEALYEANKLEGESKTLFEQLKALKERGEDLEKQKKEVEQLKNELSTGTTNENITNSLLDMFKNGKTGAQDLADFFKNTMNDAALSIFKNNVLLQTMDKFYKDFAEKAQSDNQLTEGEIADLRKLFNDLTTKAKEQFTQLQQITGSDLSTSSNSSSNTLTGQIKGITAEQANLLAGALNGLRLTQLGTNDILTRAFATSAQQLFVLQQQYLSQMQIEINSKRSADGIETYLPYLKEISINTKDSAALQLRAAGKYGY